MELDSPFSKFKFRQAKLDLEDDRPFFAMGLKSSAVNSLTSEIGKLFGVSLEVTQLFETPTPRTLRVYISDITSLPEPSVQASLDLVFRKFI